MKYEKDLIRSHQKPTTYFYVTTTMYAKLEEEKLQSKQATNKTTYLRIHSTHKSQNQTTKQMTNKKTDFCVECPKNPEKSETRPDPNFSGFPMSDLRNLKFY